MRRVRDSNPRTGFPVNNLAGCSIRPLWQLSNGSVHALAQTGELVIASNTGSQLPHIAYTSPNIIFVVSTQKITPTLDDARKRLREHVIPLEDERLMAVHNAHTHLSKELIIHYENPMMGRTMRVILVNEKLGF
jgi:hypothetical protein